ncbi:MAG: ATP-binding cassette domain-containing protein [Nitrososphaera sp.]|nr:ATP-binding cassette domain-containing protein [Nitrososphaera sp.]
MPGNIGLNNAAMAMEALLPMLAENDNFSPPLTCADSYAVQAEHLSLAFGGQQILADVSFAIPRSKAVLLQGDNGSGKTTLLNVMSGFLRPDKGHLWLRLNGYHLDSVRASPEQLARTGLGRLWQDIRLFPTMTVLENVLAATPRLVGQNPALALAIWPVVIRQGREAKERAFYHLEMVGMVERASSSADKLSVGQMKRVALARLLQCNADLFLLDEPLAGLDVESAEKLIALLNDLSKNQAKTLLVVEHQHERMAPLCDEIWYLAGGKLNRKA